MTFTESIKTCLQKYVDFNGRASRSEYWWFFLFTFIVRIVTFWIPFIGIIIALGLLLPSLSVTVRRLHDTNRTGWWVLLPVGLALGGVVAGTILSFIGLPVVGIALIAIGSIGGFVVLLVFLIQPSDPGPNQYGPNPLPRQGVGGYGYYQDPGHPYSPPPMGGYGESSYDAGLPDSLSEPGGRRFCTQCGMQLEPEARFCTACGAEV